MPARRAKAPGDSRRDSSPRAAGSNAEADRDGALFGAPQHPQLDHFPLEGIEDGTYFYFVHSYCVVPADRKVIATETDYPEPFCSMIWRSNVYATQFHPEKSQADGLRVLKNFAELG